MRLKECSIPPLMISMSDEGMSWGGNGGNAFPNTVGYRFSPTDVELVNHYLKKKIQGMDSEVSNIPEVDLCKWEPWQLPDFSVMKTDDPEWFFFSLVDYKFSKGNRRKRATNAGHWKPTGQVQEIKSGSNKIGTKQTLVYYRGSSPTAERTNWVIHEYRADIAGLPSDRLYVLCRLKRKEDDNTEYGATHYSFTSQEDDRVVTSDDDLQLQALLKENTFTPLDSVLFNLEQGLQLDIPPSPGYGSMQYFQGGYEMAFADSLINYPDEYRY